MNRTSADVIPLCRASVRTKSSASRIMTLVIKHAGHRPAKIGKDRIGKIAISIPFDRRGTTAGPIFCLEI